MHTLFSYLTFGIPEDSVLLLFRLTIGLAWLPWGIKKLSSPEDRAKFPSVFGMSGAASYWCTAAIETLVPCCVILGFLMRLALIPGIVCMAVACKVSMGKDLTTPAAPFFLGLMSLFIAGPGGFSLDALLLSCF